MLVLSKINIQKSRAANRGYSQIPDDLRILPPFLSNHFLLNLSFVSIQIVLPQSSSILPHAWRKLPDTWKKYAGASSILNEWLRKFAQPLSILNECFRNLPQASSKLARRLRKFARTTSIPAQSIRNYAQTTSRFPQRWRKYTEALRKKFEEFISIICLPKQLKIKQCLIYY